MMSTDEQIQQLLASKEPAVRAFAQKWQESQKELDDMSEFASGNVEATQGEADSIKPAAGGSAEAFNTPEEAWAAASKDKATVQRWIKELGV